MTIPVSPVLNPPRLFRPIPYIPETIAHLPHYTLDAIRLVWREACAPLYHCRCSVCERTMAAQQGNTSSKTAIIVPAPASPVKESSASARRTPTVLWSCTSPARTTPLCPTPTASSSSSRTIVAFTTRSSDGGGKGLELYWLQVEEEDGPGAWEREMELVDEMANGKWKDGADSEGAFLLDGEEYEDEEADGEAFALLPAPAVWGTGRKRSVDELEEDDAYAQSHDSRGGTLPKRARTGERVSSPRLAKRCSHSAELDVDDRDAETGCAGVSPQVCAHGVRWEPA
ncbi:hypothetical protein DFH09DRAFT_282713 [Mycena vulgaris]|nr:hypothetical protein DFH09DRAFT_282713 [Mycena vulgaris]